ncbi:MAG: DUF2029 domain-containing protein, partial [Candidatus Eremiobacteraeota bacterium]|nr:DUF2029 domain-containing protein [Candidatus Eremiobacteraeota bacterium]
TIMVALAVWAFAIVEDYPLLAGLILGASIAIKYVSVVALPFLVIRAARNGRLAGFLSAALAIGVPVICFKPFWLGPQTLYSVVGHGGTFAMSPAWMVNLPFFASGRAALPALGSSLVLPLLGQPSWPRLVQLSFVAAFCAVALFAILRFRRSRRLEELWRATSALLWASPIIHPWYLLWLLPAAAGRGRWAVYAWWFGLLIVLRYALDATHLAGQAPWGTAALVALTIAYLTLPVAVARSRRGMHPLDEVVERELPADTVWETQQRPA